MFVCMQLLSDGDEVFVEYGSGPKAFTSRWEGRPPTPDFVWDGDGVVLPPHNIWLDNMDLTHEGLHELVDKEIKDTDPEASRERPGSGESAAEAACRQPTGLLPVLRVSGVQAQLQIVSTQVFTLRG